MHGYLAMVTIESMQRFERIIQRVEGMMLSPRPEEKKRFTLAGVVIRICSSNGFAYLPNIAK